MITRCLTLASILSMVIAGALAGTGKVPVEGALAASTDDPAVGETFFVYLNATPLEAAPEVTMEIVLPAGLERADARQALRTFRGVKAGQTVTMALAVVSRAAGPKKVVASATLVDSATYTLRRSFVIVLGAEAENSAPGESGTDSRGQPLVVYPGGK